MRTTRFVYMFFGAAAVTLAGCGGADSGDTGSGGPEVAAELSIAFAPIKTIEFTWSDVPGATHYKIVRALAGSDEYRQLGDDVEPGSERMTRSIGLHLSVGSQFILQSCDETGCASSEPVELNDSLVDVIGYVKASNTGPDDNFGQTISLSGDGNIMAVSSWYEESNATGINGDQNNNSAFSAGAVYIFSRAGTTWIQQAYLKASNNEARDVFGRSLSLNDNGTVLAVGATGEDSSSATINGDQEDNSLQDAGAVYIFSRDGNLWTQDTYLKAHNPDESDLFGSEVELSSDGQTLAVNAFLEDSSATGVDGDASDNSATDSGAVYVFKKDGSSWRQQAYIKASNTGPEDGFARCSLSADGNVLAVGALKEDSDSTGINDDESNNNAPESGAAYVFRRTGEEWAQEAYIKASNTNSGDDFALSISLSDDGNTLAVSSRGDDSSSAEATRSNDLQNSGAVHMYKRGESGWSHDGFLKSDNPGAFDSFGWHVSLAGEGSIVAVTAVGERSAATGLNGDATDDSAAVAGAAYVFARTETGWIQQSYIKASNTEAEDRFGWAVSLSADGETMAVGALTEGSEATGIGGDQENNWLPSSGAVYLY